MRNPHAEHICNLTAVGDVLYIATVGRAVTALVDNITRLNIDGITIRRTKGQEQITFPNGNKLHFATTRTLHKTRGLTVWHIVTDSHTNLDNKELRQELLPCFNHPTIGQVEWYTVMG